MNEFLLRLAKLLLPPGNFIRKVAEAGIQNSRNEEPKRDHQLEYDNQSTSNVPWRRFANICWDCGRGQACKNPNPRGRVKWGWQVSHLAIFLGTELPHPLPVPVDAT